MAKRILSIILILSIIVVIIQIVKTSYKTYVSTQRVASLSDEIQQLQEENNDLHGAIEERENPLYVEKIARNKLNMVKSGEKLVVIQESEGEKVENTRIEEIQQKTPQEMWKILLFGAF